MRTTVLITGARAPVAVDIARAFRAAGCETHLADSVTPYAARCLRPQVPAHKTAPPRQDFASFRRDLAALVHRISPELILPTCEEVFWVSRAAELDGYAERVFAPPLALLRRLHSKIDFVELARASSVIVPDSWVVSSPTELSQVPLAPSEMVLKPEFSRFSTETLIRPTLEETRRTIPSTARRWVAQRFIVGTEICSWAAVRKGNVVAFAAYRPRWRHGRASIAFESVDIAAASEVMRRIAAATKMTGQISLDLIVTPDGTAIPIECNPRSVSGVHLYDAALSLAVAILGNGTAPAPPPGQLRYLGPAIAIMGLPNAVIQARIGEFIRNWKRGTDVIGRTGNRLPILGTLLDAARFAAIGLLNGRSATEQTTADIEWNGEAME